MREWEGEARREMIEVVRAPLRDRLFAAGVVLFYALNVCDALTTWIGLTQQGGTERVALYAFLFGNFPFVVGVVVKLLVTTLAALFCCWQYRQWRLAGYVLLTVANLVMLVPVINNILGLIPSR